MTPICDLHVHSTYSDGTLTPEQLIREAEEIGLHAVALCDHNTVAGLRDFTAAAANSAVIAVPGVEFSTDYEGTELHVLGLFLRPEHYGEITAFLEDFVIRKEKSNLELVAALAREGVYLDYAAVKAGTPRGQVNRAVLGAELVRLGCCSSVKEAFSRWLSEKRGLYVPPARPDPFEVIRRIRSMGGAAVLAHPFLNLDELRLREFLPRARAAGLDGMEVFYSTFSREETQTALRLAEEFDLLPSGGSDFHGENKPHIRMGVGRGDLAVPVSCLFGLAGRCGIPLNGGENHET